MDVVLTALGERDARARAAAVRALSTRPNAISVCAGKAPASYCPSGEIGKLHSLFQAYIYLRSLRLQIHTHAS
jgi:hypothetical protein